MAYFDQRKLMLEPSAFERSALRRVAGFLWWLHNGPSWRVAILLAAILVFKAAAGGRPFGDPILEGAAWETLATLLLATIGPLGWLVLLALPLSDFVAGFDPSARQALNIDATRVARASLSIVLIGLIAPIAGVMIGADALPLVLVLVGFTAIPMSVAGRPDREDIDAVVVLYRAVGLFMLPVIVLAPDPASRMFAFIAVAAVGLSWLAFDLIHGFRWVLRSAATNGG